MKKHDGQKVLLFVWWRRGCSKRIDLRYQGQFCDPDVDEEECNPTGTTTRFDWTFKGLGTEESPGSIELSMIAGTKTWSWQDVPGQFDYYYPIGGAAS